jgi:uncharacterized membrane protein YwzB
LRLLLVFVKIAKSRTVADGMLQLLN